jgi:hypothetical protein
MSLRSTPREGSVGALVDEFSRRPKDPCVPIGLLFELIATDRPPVRVVDGVGGEAQTTWLSKPVSTS